ncbi:ceramide synthase 2-like isoform X1 [Dunckerocampus dactyliophorus]|uniref:ceramide synthase 2-like isoform X1 n=2 Tax=Dunckerocampus dactyliophorus TaxID=161453 RepID=UPI002406C856|nr:ceramide synthase 2-like isoform X1 [Dunckerocampus dactyliophorus]
MDLLPDLWRQDYWLPPGVTWNDMNQLADSERPLPRDLLVALPLALGFVLLRYVFERFFAPPLGRCLGVRNRLQMTAEPSPKLESFYTQQSRRPTQGDVVNLMFLCGKSQRQIETWFRLRRQQDRPCQTRKFGEAAWRFFFYLVAFIAGLTCLVDAPWFWDLRECWRQYPVQPMQRVHYWYYMLELGFYGSLLLRISVDIKRKDFKEQVVHHLATIFLLSFSYCANYIRIGTLVMLLHDSSDILLESAKMFNYGSGWRKVCDTLFVVFTVVFLLTRLVIFPSKIIHTTLVLSMEMFQPFAGYYCFNLLLMVLQALHVFWAGLILRMVYKFLKGKLEKDERSDEDTDLEVDRGEEVQEGDYYQKTSKDTQNYKLPPLSNSCVLNNLTNHRASIADNMRKAQ